jgi:hypothetical protein
MRKLATIAIAAFAVAALAFAPGAMARSRHHRCAMGARVDRNHDRLPDRWECRHHLSLRVNQARRDQDRDHLNNAGELEHKTNPRDADSDNDGIKDGDELRQGLNPRDRDSDDDGVEDEDEGAGKVESFDSNTGTLTIRRDDNSLLTGQVTAETRIECETEDEFENENENETVAHESSDGGDDHSGSDDGDRVDNSGPGSGDDDGDRVDNSGPGSLNSGPGDAEDENDENDENDERNCSTADLQPGTPVHEAEVENGVFREVELVK